MIPIYLDQVPAGSSTRPFVHYAQLNQLERQFRMFDFGSEELNIENYGQPVPPNHNLKNVQVYWNYFSLDTKDRILKMNFFQNFRHPWPYFLGIKMI